MTDVTTKTAVTSFRKRYCLLELSDFLKFFNKQVFRTFKNIFANIMKLQDLIYEGIDICM